MHHGFRIVVAEDADNWNRIPREASLNQAVDRRGIRSAVFTIQQDKIETGIAQKLAQPRFWQPEGTTVDRSAGLEEFAGLVRSHVHGVIDSG